MRPRKPWYRRSTDAWYVEVGGKQVLLAKGKSKKKEAEGAFYRLMLDHGQPTGKSAELNVAMLCDLYLDHKKPQVSPLTFEWETTFLSQFCDRYAELDCAQLKPFHLTRWLDSKPNWKGARRHAQVIVKRSFAWAKGEGLVAENPFAGVKNPRGGRRERVVTPHEKELILGSIKDIAFRKFLLALMGTGCRPSEVAKVTAENVKLDLGIWRFEDHKTRKQTGKPRNVFLSPEMLEITKEQLEKHPTGPLFPNIRGRRFTPNAWRCRFRRLRRIHAELKGVDAYCFRHTYTTDALANGVGIAQVAALLGHSDTQMVSTVYSHIADNLAHMKDAAAMATKRA